MTHLYIELNTNLIEEVSVSLITKLYNLVISGDLDNTSNFSGRLHSTSGYGYQIDYLTNNFLNLFILVDINYIKFEDNNVLLALLLNILCDGIGISEANVLVPTDLFSLGLRGNSLISSFTELSKFTNITTSSSGDAFNGCTNLEWISLPNNNSGLGTTFQISGGKKLKWVVPSIEFVCSKNFLMWNNNPARGGGSDTAWKLYNLNKQPIDDVVIPEGVSTIGKYVFGKMACNSISFPSTITTIKENAFEEVDTTLKYTLNLPNLLTLEKNAFLKSAGLNSILDLGNITQIPQNCFNQSGLTSAALPSTVTELKSGAFQNCSHLSTITGTNNITTIGGSAFLGCSSLTSFDFSNITSIGKDAFKSTHLTGSITLSSCTQYPENPFSNCNYITEIHAPNVVTMDDSSDVFSNLPALLVLDFPLCSVLPNCDGKTNLTTVNFPSATTLGNDGFVRFLGCTNLTTLNIPFSSIITTIGGWMFNGCSGLNGQTFDFGTSITKVGALAFSNTSINLIFRNTSVIPTDNWGGTAWANYGGFVYVPDNLVSSYLAASEWSRISNLIKGISELPSS